MKRSYLIFFSIGLMAALCFCAAAQDETADDWYKKGLDLGRNGSYEEAVFAYNSAIELEPNNATFYTAIVPNLNTLAFTTNNQSKRNESMKAIDKALQIDPGNPLAWEMKGEVLYQMEKYNESVDAYDKALKNIGSYRQDIHANQTEFLSYIWTSKSISLWQLMRYNESLAAVDKAVQIDPAGNYDAWAFKGELLASIGRYNESLLAFEGAAATVAARSQSEIRSLPWAKEGYVLMQMGRYEEADGIFQKIIGLNITGEGANRRLADAWRGRGNALAKLGEYNESLQAFDKSIELYEYNAPYAWTGKGDALRSSGRYDEAVKAFDRALELYPIHADAGIAHAQKGRGDSLTCLGKHDEALEAYGAAVEASDKVISAFNNATPLDRAVSFTFDLYPLDQKFWIDRGSALKALGREDEAKDAYENALDSANKSLLQSPQDFNAHDAKGKILFELSRYDESIQVYDQFIKTDPGPEASATALVWKGKLLFEMGRANESLDSLNQAVEVDPQSAEAWRWKAGIAAELGMYEEALAAYNETLQIGGQTENAEIWREKSGILKALGRQSEADEAYAEARELGYNDSNPVQTQENTAEAWFKRGSELFKDQSYDEAIEAMDKVLKVNPKNETAWDVKGSSLVLLASNMYDEALKCFDKALEIYPQDIWAWNGKGDAFNHMRRYEDAIKAYDKALEIDAQAFGPVSGKASALWKLGRHNESLKTYDDAIELTSQDSEKALFWFDKAHLLAENGNCNETVKALEEASKLAPQDKDLWINGGVLLSAHLGRYDEALKYYEKALQIDSADSYAWYAKGEMLKALGRQSEADEAYAKAKELGYPK